MSDTNASASVTIPAAPAASVSQAPAAAVDPVADAGAAQQGSQDSKRQRARDAAGKYLADRRAEAIAAVVKADAPPAPAASATEASVAPAAKAEDKVTPAPAATGETSADPPAPEAPADKAVVDAAEQRRKDAEAEEKSWREIRRRKRQQRDERAALAADRAAVAAEKDRLAKVEAERVEDEKLKLSNPDKWLEKHKFDFREVALREVQKQQLTPEQKAAEERFAKLEAELKAERQAREALERETAERKAREEKAAEAKKQAEALEHLASEVRTEWSAAKTDFPTLDKFYGVDEIVEAANQVRLDYYKRTKLEAPLEDVFAFMEKNAIESVKRFSRQETAERVERETTAAPAAKTRAKVGPPVTNQVSATRASPPKPLSGDQKRAAAVARASEVMGPRH